MGRRISDKAASFGESVIREMSRLAARHSAINLAQGFPDFPAPEQVKEAACRAIGRDVNQYAITWGARGFREGIAQKYQRFYDWEVDPEREITVACGATECMMAAVLALVNPGEKVMVMEPFYENYGPDAILAGAEPVYVSLDPEKGWALDFDEMEDKLRAESRRGGVRALILNSPHNPAGKVFSRDELTRIAELACRFDFYVITDEIYEHIIYDGHRHLPIALIDGMSERTVTISGLSKSYSVTGWRIGYILAPADLSEAVRKVHDFLTVGAAAPLQEAGAAAVSLPDHYYQSIAQDYLQRRDFMLPVLEACGFRFQAPQGAYYVLADISRMTDLDDVGFVRHLIREYGVAAVPGSSFYADAEKGRRCIRFAFCKSLELLDQAAQRLTALAS